VLVGMPGCGKTAIGQRLAYRLGLPFFDADSEIAAAARMSIPEIFAKFGEAYFRDGERRVMFRLLNQGPAIVATGGGAFLNPATRQRVGERAVSLWFDADFDTLIKRIRRKSDRPLLQNADPEGTLRRLMEERNPVYARADLKVVSRDEPQDAMTEEALDMLARELPGVMRRVAQRDDSSAVLTAPAGARATSHRETYRVDLGERSYDIVIGAGLLTEAGARIAALAPGAACAIVTDANVAPLYLPALEASLAAQGMRFVSIVVEPGEGSKSFAVFERVLEQAIAAKIERRDVIVALGGGVVGDLAGFVAASLRRGSRFVQIPTSLLAQVDSSVGGKTGINSPQGKNLIGAFHQPALVLADVDTLKTLPEREFRAGYAEIVKYGLIGDRRFFDWLEADGDAVFRNISDQIVAIAVSCRAKAHIVARDETEQGDRALLNLGHTFGHAFERLVEYDPSRLVHGEGVAIGLACATRFSRQLGLCSGQDAVRVERHLERLGLMTRIGDIPEWNFGADAILEAMRQDKKVERGALTFVLLRGIGEAFVAKSVDAGDVLRFLESEL
jgi:shikimate kinase/3-dehydroquinate synthase